LGAYCSQCGEKRRDRSDFKLSTIASETVGEITNLEHSKLWQTFRLLLLKPGQLTRDHWVGRRKRYLGPVKLYLIVFAISLVLYSIHQPTAIYDVRTFVAADRAGDASRLLDNIAEKRGIRREQVTQELNSRWQSYISMSQVVYPLFVGLALKLLFLRRGLYFAEHLIFALHVLAFMFFSFALAWPLFLLFGVRTPLGQYSPGYLLITFASLTWLIIYLVLALRRAYGESWIAAILKSAVVFLTYMVTSIFFISAILWLAIALTRRGGWFG
jgi:hypothetical protein